MHSKLGLQVWENTGLDENELGETGPSLPKRLTEGLCCSNPRKVRMSIDRFHRMFFPNLVWSFLVGLIVTTIAAVLPISILARKPTVSPIWGTSCRVTVRCSLQCQLDLHSRQHEVALENRMTAPSSLTS